MPCACCLYPNAAEVPALPSKKRDRTAGEREQCLHCALPGQARDAATGLLPPPTGDFVIAAPIPVPAHALRTDYGLGCDALGSGIIGMCWSRILITTFRPG